MAEGIILKKAKFSGGHYESRNLWNQILWQPLVDCCPAPQRKLLSLEEVLKPSITSPEICVSYYYEIEIIIIFIIVCI